MGEKCGLWTRALVSFGTSEMYNRLGWEWWGLKVDEDMMIQEWALQNPFSGILCIEVNNQQSTSYLWYSWGRSRKNERSEYQKSYLFPQLTLTIYQSWMTVCPNGLEDLIILWNKRYLEKGLWIGWGTTEIQRPLSYLSSQKWYRKFLHRDWRTKWDKLIGTNIGVIGHVFVEIIV